MRSKAVVLPRIAFANITSSTLNVFVGLFLLFGAALLVIGSIPPRAGRGQPACAPARS